MSTLARIPAHEPIEQGLPRNISLREIARLRNPQRKLARATSRFEMHVDSVMKREPAAAGNPRYVERKFRFVLCPSPLPDSHARTIFGCLTCGNSRSWGFQMPDDNESRPRLKCACCKVPTRHGFLGVIGRTL